MAALTAAPRSRVALVTKGALEEGCSRWAQGGIAAAVGPDDSPEQHAADTLAAGRGLGDPRAVAVLVEEGPRRVRELVEWGVGFDTQDGRLTVGREAAHSRPRIIHARGDATGLEIETTLVARLRASPVAVFERHRVTGLVRDGRGACVGVDAVDVDSGARRRLGATATILASGGAGRLWRQTTNPRPATGDGVALAYAAGAEVAGMEFVQFHPTALALEGAPRFLISEAVRGEGALVVNGDGERFLLAADPRAELAGRDVVAQAIWAELQRSGQDRVYLDCRPLGDRAAVRFPTIHATCRSFGIDIGRDLVPIAPAAHYLIGGVRTDLDAATSVAGLYACGEVASSGVHGANRLASNSLLESTVFAHRAVEAALHRGAEMPPPEPDAAVDAPLGEAGAGLDTAGLTERIRDAMWAGAGLVRDAAGLARTIAVLDEVGERCGADPVTATVTGLDASLTTARLVCAAAQAREESRGSHCRADFPSADDRWLATLIMQKERGARRDSHARSDH